MRFEPDPNFGRLKTALMSSVPDRVPLAEITIDEGAKEAFLTRTVNDLETDIEFEFIQNNDPRINDQIMSRMPQGSVVINATGMGKDTPGSTVTDQGAFPRSGIAWEIYYRGELDFWHPGT